MRGSGQRGRWQDCETCPPGGGWACKVLRLGPCFSDLRPSMVAGARCPSDQRLFQNTFECQRRGDVADGEAGTVKNRQCPTPAAGRIGLAIWPSSGLAPPQHLASGGTRAMGRSAVQAENGLAKQGPRERCPALILIAHAQASKRAATGLPLRARQVTYRRRRGSEGHFLRHKRLHGGGSDLRFRGGDGAIPRGTR